MILTVVELVIQNQVAYITDPDLDKTILTGLMITADIIRAIIVTGAHLITLTIQTGAMHMNPGDTAYSIRFLHFTRALILEVHIIGIMMVSTTALTTMCSG